ncbi:hypothetical protein [Mucilaginibacter psychrotolerans]|uniref:Uncharacterized protein n=1 Tax=Mucilaginibacter psychrotolerans TaxID=1524096 RepID=A0A4Y8S5Q8_9SPHI|nr:hypothetical protein [Mucilaginibacter psychrotolerans]TFF33807.1 hypothetical protein E2R66_24050 [Mucilaginibacter psychrotolerans]
MKYIWQIIRKHFFSVFFYVLFFVLFVMHVLKQLKYEQIKAENNGEWPYAHREWVGVLFYIAGILFLIICMFNGALKRNKGDKFYFVLGLAILVPMIIYGIMVN